MQVKELVLGEDDRGVLKSAEGGQKHFYSLPSDLVVVVKKKKRQ